LVPSFANLRSNLIERDFAPKVLERLLPRLRMQIDGIEQSAIDIENHCFCHCELQPRCTFGPVAHFISSINTALSRSAPSGTLICSIVLYGRVADG
jgi:hypothetical protein